jgi:glycosyltransferase involved in cell wall biosynthesis
MADAIIRLMDDDELRARLGKAGRRRVVDKYDLEKNTAKLLNIMQSRLTDSLVRTNRAEPRVDA